MRGPTVFPSESTQLERVNGDGRSSEREKREIEEGSRGSVSVEKAGVGLTDVRLK